MTPTVNRPPRRCRVAEWAELVGERVPESVASDGDRRASDGDRRASDASGDAPGDEAP